LKIKNPRALLGWSNNLKLPKYPRDDKTVSKKETPEEKGYRPCRHCRSGKHWDYECRYGKKEARTNLASTVMGGEYDDEDNIAQKEYDQGYHEASYSDEELEEETITDDDIDGDLISDSEEESFSVHSHHAMTRKNNFRQGGSSETSTETPIDKEPSQAEDSEDLSHPVDEFVVTSFVNEKDSKYSQHPYKERVVRAFSVESKAEEQGTEDPNLLVLKQKKARIEGASFLGSRAATVPITMMDRKSENAMEAVIDSGSDITLISYDAWKGLKPKTPKMKQGQNVTLIEVTGETQLMGFVKVPIFFETRNGPVKLEVEAYIVKGMATPFILGNDFAYQYNLSIIREDDRSTVLSFGSSGRSCKESSLV
jgi:hypothetical protein